MSALEDRIAIEDLVSRLGLCLDGRRYDALGSVFTADAVGVFPGITFQGLAEIEAHARRNLPQYERIQHVISNVLVEPGGDDRARVSANLVATHVHPGGDPRKHFQTGCTYRFEVVRAADGWRIARVELDVVWVVGEPV